MGYFVRLSVILMVITGVAAGSLALVNLKTRPIIEEYKRMEEAKARSEVMKEGMMYTLCDSASTMPYYMVYADEAGEELIGYIYTAKGKGYSSTLETVTGIDTSFNIVGIKIIYQQETPGLGAKCQEVLYGEKGPWFQRIFSKSHRKRALNALTVEVGWGEDKIHAITGATITTRAITNSIKEAATVLKSKLKEAK